MKQLDHVKDARSMVKEAWTDRRVEKLSRENDELRQEMDELRHDLDAEQGRAKESMAALAKSNRRGGKMKWLMLAGGAYVLGAKAGRARYEQMMGWVRSMAPSEADGAPATPSTPASPSEI